MQPRSKLKPRPLRPTLPLTLAFLAAVLAGPGMSQAQQPPPPKPQRIVVIDADTVEINGDPAQLFGIDAPELGQLCLNGEKAWHCGRDAAFMLKKIITLDHITCMPFGSGGGKPGEPYTAVCKGSKQDVAEVLLRSGYAVALQKTMPAYTVAEGEARNTGVGLWRGRFISPAAWREGERLKQEAERTQPSCNVKGMIDDEGRRVYFVPTDERYNTIKIDIARGERMFCSDEEARAAQWKRPPRP